jgi:hypothetical protein
MALSIGELSAQFVPLQNLISQICPTSSEFEKNGYLIFIPTFSQQMITEFGIVPFSNVWNSSRFYFILLLILNKSTNQYFR